MLTPAQLNYIDKHLRSDNWLLNNDLIAELTDHYTNAIIDKLDENVPFEVALHDVHRSFGGRSGLLKMEENYQKVQAQTNARIYRNAFKEAFQLPGLGYTLLVWAVCYGVVRTLPFDAVAKQLNDLDMGFFLVLLLGVVGSFVYAFVWLYNQLRAGTFSLQSAHVPTYTMVQSTVCLAYLFVALPVRHFAEAQPVLCSLLMTLVLVHEWAGMHMLAFVYRKRLA